MNNKNRVFEFLYKNHENEYNINQISRIVGISVGSAFKILKELENLGYITVGRKNNALLHKINLSESSKEFYEKIEEDENTKSRKKTKIVCSITPTCKTLIKKLIENGMNVASIDASSLNHKTALELVQSVRQASDEMPILLNVDLKDKQWIKLALKNDVDFVAIAAANAYDVVEVNKSLGYSDIKQIIGEKIKVIATINKDSLRNYKEIVEEAYGIIIDRSKLTTNLEMLPKLQKEIIDECNKHGKPAIIAGSVLDSMAEGRLLQAEIYDISNAVLEGASALMLSGAAIQNNPAKAVETLSKIIKSAEMGWAGIDYNNSYDLTHFIGKTVSELEKTFHIDALLIITSGGYSARMISSRRLKCRTIAATSRKKILRQLNLLWGIEPLHAEIDSEDISNKDKKEVISKALKKGFIGKRDQIAIIASIFHSKTKRTNLLEIHNVSEFLEYLNKMKEAH